MTWEIEIVEQVRVLINDLADTPTYTDARIERVIIIAANQVTQELQFERNYIVDISDADIVPDPTDSDPKDYTFMNLIALKAACLIMGGELKQYSLIGGISVKDGPSSIDTGNLFKNLSELSKQICGDYAAEKTRYQMGYNGTNRVGSVNTPFTQQSTCPNNFRNNQY